jgi:hypothetical protein
LSRDASSALDQLAADYRDATSTNIGEVLTVQHSPEPVDRIAARRVVTWKGGIQLEILRSPDIYFWEKLYTSVSKWDYIFGFSLSQSCLDYV